MFKGIKVAKFVNVLVIDVLVYVIDVLVYVVDLLVINVQSFILLVSHKSDFMAGY